MLGTERGSLQAVTLTPCDDVLVYNLGEQSLGDHGCVLVLTLTLSGICPEKRVALAVTVNELDADGAEYPRGLRTALLPAHHEAGPKTITLPSIRFVLPGALDVGGGTRRLLVRTDCHYVDYHASSLLPEQGAVPPTE